MSALIRTACRLRPTPGQRRALRRTLAAFAVACRDAMRAGRDAETTANTIIHKRCYKMLRRRHKLSANLTIRAIARAARTLKHERAAGRESLPVGIPLEPGASMLEEDWPSDEITRTAEYDARTASISAPDATASLSTVDGRVRDITVVMSDRQVELFHTQRIIRGCLCETCHDAYWLALDLVPVQQGGGQSTEPASPEGG